MYINFIIWIEKRKAEADKIRERYSDRIPVICEKSENSKLPDIDKTKYLVPNDLSAYHFNYIIRKRIKLPETSSLYFFVNGRYLLKGGRYKHSFTRYTYNSDLKFRIFLWKCKTICLQEYFSDNYFTY